MNRTEDGITPGAAQTIKNLLRPGAETRASALDKLAELLASSTAIGALVILHGIGLVLWIAAASLGLLSGVSTPNSNYVGLLAVFLPLEAVLLCALVLVRQDRMGSLAEERSRLSVRAALLLEAEVTEVLQQLAQINARLSISQQGTERGRGERRPSSPESPTSRF